MVERRASSPNIAALAVELGDFTPGDRLVQETEALAGPVRQAGEGDRANGG
ncbi:DUF6420 family protein [Streptomyces canus]|uniref:DUF6420 family protein n=1 Tax=Streptomyces canus TaxID=58343 RepID=UPI00225151BB|nr:DUF6420 family protein [Streptomyces canus]MCX5256750.1 DUF6420 family protein [Streptomyces canus]